jgi:hypothetical protein
LRGCLEKFHFLAVLEVSLLRLSEVPAHLIEFSAEDMLAMGIDVMLCGSFLAYASRVSP